MEEIKIDPEFLKKLAMQGVPDDPPRTIDGRDIPIEEIKKSLFKHYGVEE